MNNIKQCNMSICSTRIIQEPQQTSIFNGASWTKTPYNMICNDEWYSIYMIYYITYNVKKIIGNEISYGKPKKVNVMRYYKKGII